MSNPHNLLSFVRSDPDPPFPAEHLADHWWYVKPLLEYIYLYKSVPERELPNLWLGSWLVGHRFQTRRVFERAKPRTLREFDDAIAASTAEPANGGPVRDDLKAVCTLRDPTRFPDDSAVYRSADVLAQAVEIVERNSAALESTRRRLLVDVEKAEAEVKRLEAALYLTRRLRARAEKAVEQARKHA